MTTISDSENYYIAYGDAAALAIKNAIYDGLPKGRIVCFRDDFTQGPIQIDFKISELRKRLSFWHELSDVLYNVSDIDKVLEYSMEELEEIPAKSSVYIWTGYSAYDQLATMWVSNVLNINKMQIFENRYKEDVESEQQMLNIAMLSPQEIALSYSDFELLHPMKIQEWAGEWRNLANNDKGYRLLADGKIVNEDITYFENIFGNYISDEFILARDLIENILTQDVHPLSDVTVEHVIRVMIEKGILVMEGDFTSMNSYKVKRK